MESCRQQFLTKGGLALAQWSGSAALLTMTLSYLCTTCRRNVSFAIIIISRSLVSTQVPIYRQRFNWRGQIFCTLGAGIAAFWIKGEDALHKCHHARDAERLKDIREGRTLA